MRAQLAPARPAVSHSPPPHHIKWYHQHGLAYNIIVSLLFDSIAHFHNNTKVGPQIVDCLLQSITSYYQRRNIYNKLLVIVFGNTLYSLVLSQ